MLKIEPKTDVIGLAAFVLALGAAAAQFVAWTRGPTVWLLGPERVALYLQKARDGSLFVRIAAPLAYANTAGESFAAILSRERVTMTLGPLSSRQDWNAFGTIARPGDRLEVAATSLVAPQAVSGQSAVSHITLFTPVPRPCEAQTNCEPKVDFLTPDALARHLVAGAHIGFEFESSFFKDRPKRYSCKVSVTRDVVARWAKEHALYATCREPRVEADALPRGAVMSRTLAWIKARFYSARAYWKGAID